MKIGIAGAGAMGCKFAWRFLSAGYDVFLYEKHPSAAAALSSSGLTIIDNGRKINISARVSSAPSILNESDILFFFVKGYSTIEAARELSEIISEKTIAVSLQNGLGNFDALAEFFPPERIVFGSTSEGAAKLSPSEIVNGGSGLTVIGGMDEDAAGVVENVLRGAGFTVEVTDEPGRAVWKKAVVNSAINPIGAVLNFTNGEIAKNSFSRELLEGIVAESVSAARAAGIDLDRDEMVSHTMNICGLTSSNRCSMLQDIEGKRKTEIDCINGHIIKIARDAELNCGMNRSVYLLVKSLETNGNR